MAKVKPLNDLLRKDVVFKFDKSQLDCFEFLRDRLISAPIIKMYSLSYETELHCVHGFGSTLFQRQNEDEEFYPI